MTARSTLAPAKVNLTLHIRGRRPDGYHELESLIAFATVGDRVAVRAAPARELTVTGPFAAALTAAGPETDNLVCKAADGFVAAFGGGPFAIDLEKVLPVAAGIGGGSADAPATLRLLAEAAGVPLQEPRLVSLAGRLGADVPASLGGRPCVVSGYGEVVAPLPRFPSVPIVLINPGVAVPTAEVFARWHQASSVMPDDGWRVAVGAVEDAVGLAKALSGSRNMLERPACALAPIIGDVLARLDECEGCLLARMSGSGATCFGLFADDDTAHAAAARLSGIGSEWWVVASRLGGWSP